MNASGAGGGGGNSFCTGQFSARSTSFGGSNEGSSSSRTSRTSRTRDERFSDYTDASRDQFTKISLPGKLILSKRKGLPEVLIL